MTAQKKFKRTSNFVIGLVALLIIVVVPETLLLARLPTTGSNSQSTIHDNSTLNLTALEEYYVEQGPLLNFLACTRANYEPACNAPGLNEKISPAEYDLSQVAPQDVYSCIRGNSVPGCNVIGYDLP